MGSLQNVIINRNKAPSIIPERKKALMPIFTEKLFRHFTRHRRIVNLASVCYAVNLIFEYPLNVFCSRFTVTHAIDKRCNRKDIIISWFVINFAIKYSFTYSLCVSRNIFICRIFCERRCKLSVALVPVTVDPLSAVSLIGQSGVDQRMVYFLFGQ